VNRVVDLKIGYASLVFDQPTSFVLIGNIWENFGYSKLIESYELSMG